MSDINELTKSLEEIEQELAEKAVQETILTQQIAELRHQLSKLAENKREIRNKKYSIQREMESEQRRQELEKEQQKIAKDLVTLRAEMEERIKDAPWRESAFEWQIDGAVKLAGAKRAILADVRGMGKTLSSLVWRRAVASKRTLVLTRNQYAWEFMREVSHWEPSLSVVPLIAASPLQRKTVIDLLNQQDEYIVIANFEMWRRNEDAIVDLLKLDLDGIILDEAHQLKTFGSVTTKGFLQLAPTVENLLEMTGTPVQNRPQELFALLHALYPHLFPKASYFVRDYCLQIGQNRWVWAPGGLNALMKKMSNFFVARTPDDVGHKIPPPTVHEYELNFDGYVDQKEAYQFMAERALAKLKSGKTLPLTSQLALMTRQAQLTAWPAGIIFKEEDEETGEVHYFRWDVHESVKLDWAEDIVDDLMAEEQRVVLFSRFKEPIWELERRLSKNYSVAVITGEVKDTRAIIQDFDLKTAPKNPEYQVLLATYDTIGEGVNLNSARHLIQLDRYWKPARDDQAIGRIDRINSIDQATVYRANVKDTIDDFMIKLISQKRDMLSNFRGASEMQEGLIENLEGSL